MPISLVTLALFTLLALPVTGDILDPNAVQEIGPVQPALPPDASISTNQAVAPITRDIPQNSAYPERILIPAIGLNSPVIQVGVNTLGEMDVPDGSSNNVGWYKHGTIPGTTGSAVMDAHVFAAFKKLKKAQVGDRIYVLNGRGETVTFKIISSKVYPRAEVPMETIFTDVRGSYLNLITCEGRYSIRDATYSDRRVVYAELVQ